MSVKRQIHALVEDLGVVMFYGKVAREALAEDDEARETAQLLLDQLKRDQTVNLLLQLPPER